MRTDPRKALLNLADALVEDLMQLSDEELLAELREDGIDIEAEAARMRELCERAIQKARGIAC